MAGVKLLTTLTQTGVHVWVGHRMLEKNLIRNRIQRGILASQRHPLQCLQGHPRLQGQRLRLRSETKCKIEAKIAGVNALALALASTVVCALATAAGLALVAERVGLVQLQSAWPW